VDARALYSGCNEKRFSLFLLAAFASVLLEASQPEIELDPIPQPLTNNAVLATTARRFDAAFFMG